jgi:hypothetical protein
MIARVKLIALCLLIAPAFAADAFYLGNWKIESAVVAPWWGRPGKPDAAEMNALTGKTIQFAAKSVSGPPPLTCRDPQYKVKDYTVDMLFEGGFGEMHERDRSVNESKVAESVGFRGSKWKTLETGCANELDFHFIDPDTAAFALNDYIYTLKRQH